MLDAEKARCEGLAEREARRERLQNEAEAQRRAVEAEAAAKAAELPRRLAAIRAEDGAMGPYVDAGHEPPPASDRDELSAEVRHLASSRAASVDDSPAQRPSSTRSFIARAALAHAPRAPHAHTRRPRTPPHTPPWHGTLHRRRPDMPRTRLRPAACAQVAAVERRLHAHSEELKAEAKELDAFRFVLSSHANRSSAASVATASTGAGAPPQQQRRAVPPSSEALASYSSRESLAPRVGGGGSPSGCSGCSSYRSSSQPAPRPTYHLRSLVHGADEEEHWWDRYRRDVLHSDAQMAEVV